MHVIHAHVYLLIYIYIYIYICIYIYIYIYIYNVHTYIWPCLHAFMYVRYVHMYTQTLHLPHNSLSTGSVLLDVMHRACLKEHREINAEKHVLKKLSTPRSRFDQYVCVCVRT